MLAFAGTTELQFGRRERAFFSSHPGALVLVGRCDLSGFVQFRHAGQNWVLDTNDSVANQEETYKRADKYRRLVCATRKSWLSRLRAAEHAFARRYDRIINISREDHQFFAAAAPEKVRMEDTDVVLPANLPPKSSDIDVGFIGGSFIGAVRSAENLIGLAQRPDMGRLRFCIAGRVCEPLSGRSVPPNITLAGTVEDSLSFLRRCRCVVLFANRETGASVKFQESLAAGCVVIANRNAARFSLARAGETHLEVETIDDVARLLRSGVAWEFSPRNLQPHFTRAAFHRRFAAALGWPAQAQSLPLAGARQSAECPR
jgi:hypothetical protein